MEQSVYNKSRYSQGSHSLEDQPFCYCVTEREFGVIDTWCVKKEHNVGPRERCSVGMKNIVPPLLTSVTFAYAHNVVSFASLTMYFRLSFSTSSHTHIAHQSFCNICWDIWVEQRAAEYHWRREKEQSQDQFSSVNPEFPWDGVIGARKFAKQRQHKTLDRDSLQLLPYLCLNIKENSTAQTKHSSLSTYQHPYPDTTTIYMHLAGIRLFMLIISISKHGAYYTIKALWKEGWMDLSLWDTDLSSEGMIVFIYQLSSNLACTFLHSTLSV